MRKFLKSACHIGGCEFESRRPRWMLKGVAPKDATPFEFMDGL